MKPQIFYHFSVVFQIESADVLNLDSVQASLHGINQLNYHCSVKSNTGIKNLELYRANFFYTWEVDQDCTDYCRNNYGISSFLVH